jgi:carboxymethylenebutenolidase
MKKLILYPLSILLFLSANLAAQTCCQLETMGDYQLLGGSLDFIRAHAEPLPFTFVSKEGGEMISFPTKDSTGKAGGFLIKAKKKSNKWLLVYQEWWGLNDYVKKQAEAFYTDLGGEVNVLALDMYDGKVATKREDAGKYMGEAKEERLESIMKGAVKFAGKKAQFASVGWCFGGGLSLKSAIVEGKRAVGCIMYYGMPVKDVEKLKTLSTDVKGYFSGREKWINKTVVEEFAKNMITAGKVLDYKIYDADHGFANPSNPIFDKAATEETYAASIKYLKLKFGI